MKNRNIFLGIIITTISIFILVTHSADFSDVLWILIIIFIFFELIRQYKFKKIHNELLDTLDESEVEKITILNSTNEVMMYLDPDLKVKYINKAGIKDFGLAEDQIIGAFCYKIRYRKKIPCDNCPAIKAIKTGEIHSEEITDINGETWLITSIPVKNKDGFIKGAVETNVNITKRKEFENSLVKAKELAEQASKAKSDFLANMSHEIRTPMNGVLGFIQILEETNLDPEQKEYVNEIKKSSEVLLNVINDILDFSKIEAGMMSLNQTSFNLRSCIEDTVRLYSSIACQKGVGINALIHSNIPKKVISDPGRLRQILNNLVSNALKFTSKGEVFVEALLKPDKDDKLLIEFSVTDTGCGIPKDKMDVIFESFYQIDTSSTKKYGGTGLGLAISKKLIEMMNGNISVESEEGKGTKFTFTLEMEKIEEEEEEDNCKNIPELNGKKILIADDNTTNLKILRIYLEEAKCIVYETTKATKIISILDKNNIDAVLIDFNMPGMDGFEIAKTIERDSQFKDIPLILLTSFARRGDAALAKEAGFSGYLTKPVKKEDLLNTISMLILKSEKNSNKHVFVTKYDAKENKFDEKSKILIAEDDKTNQKVLLKMLSNLGFYCDVADNGEKAVLSYKNNFYDLVFMDCQMPVMNGWESTKLIREYEKENNKKAVPIIALTAYALEGDNEKCIITGMNEYMTKPVDKKKLIEILNKYLNIGIQSSIREFRDKTGISDSEAQEIFDNFFNTFAQRIAEFNEALNNENYDQLSGMAHSLKGSFANLYILDFKDLTIELEHKAKSKDFEACRELIEKIKSIQSLYKHKAAKSF